MLYTKLEVCVCVRVHVCVSPTLMLPSVGRMDTAWPNSFSVQKVKIHPFQWYKKHSKALSNMKT